MFVMRCVCLCLQSPSSTRSLSLCVHLLLLLFSSLPHHHRPSSLPFDSSSPLCVIPDPAAAVAGQKMMFAIRM